MGHFVATFLSTTMFFKYSQPLFIKVDILDHVDIYMGWKWEARLEERFASYVMDGLTPGWGVSEWNYRHHGGRPTNYFDTDKERFSDSLKY